MRSPIAFAAALFSGALLVLASAPAVAEGKRIHAREDWAAYVDDAAADKALRYCVASTRSSRGDLSVRVYAGGEWVMIVRHRGWKAPASGVAGGYELVLDDGAVWRLDASMQGDRAVTTALIGTDQVAALQSALVAGREATLQSDQGAVLDRFSLRGAAAFDALDRCTVEMLPQEWGEDEDMSMTSPADPLRESAMQTLPPRGAPDVADYPAADGLVGPPAAPDFRGIDKD
jgi:hypothetical protein